MSVLDPRALAHEVKRRIMLGHLHLVSRLITMRTSTKAGQVRTMITRDFE